MRNIHIPPRIVWVQIPERETYKLINLNDFVVLTLKVPRKQTTK